MTSRRVDFSSPGVGKTSPGLVKPYTASRWTDGCMGGNSGTICKRMQTRDVALLAMNEMFRIYVRAYIRKKYPQKVFTRSQRVSKQLKFSGLRCEGLGFSSLHTPHRPFTPAMAVKRRWFNSIFVLRKNMRRSMGKGSCRQSGVKHWRRKHSHWFPMKIRKKRAWYEGMNVFFGK